MKNQQNDRCDQGERIFEEEILYRMEQQQELPSVDSKELLEHLTQIEGVAEDILSSRRELIDLDRQRNKTREAVRALQSDKSDDKAWVCAGKMFLKMEKKKAIKMLSNDFEVLDKEICSVRAGLRPMVNKLRDLENKDDLKGFHLNPLTPEERASVNSLLL